MPGGVRKAPGDAFQVGEHAIAPLRMQSVERVGEIGAVIHWVVRPIDHRAGCPGGPMTFSAGPF